MPQKNNKDSIGQKPFFSDATGKFWGFKRYCTLCNKYGIPKVKYASHYINNCFGLNKKYSKTNKYLGGGLGKRDYYVKYFSMSGKNLNKELNALKN